MKRLFLAFIVGILMFVGSCVEFPEKQVSQTEDRTTSSVNTVIETKSPSREAEPKKIVLKASYQVNNDVEVDYLTYRVTKVETFTEMGSSIYNKKTEGKFVKVHLKITNNAKETKDILSPRFKIEDSQGRMYDRLSDDMLYIADYLKFGEQLQPGLAVSGAVVFEMPKDAEHLRLQIRGDWLSASEIKVELSNIQNVGKDVTQKQEQDKVWDEVMEESQVKTEELMSKCNDPFKCSSDCATASDVGRKDCPSGQLCCLVEQSKVDENMDKLMAESEQRTQEIFNKCNSPFRCNSACPEYMDVGQKDCPSGEVCCMQ